MIPTSTHFTASTTYKAGVRKQIGHSAHCPLCATRYNNASTLPTATIGTLACSTTPYRSIGCTSGNLPTARG